ncbi:hypothetical protein M409DRAFT_56825 [Zasmidium cellare ATCC 36951]|uniref:Uncharacterized protein n=1 Tax=Zasmidium cellare ATCC 36951 TaxID=1080233 RepID=A0A6A6CBE5_ZASCE|nr:uncharacterized protein M409DRAFT_56825 [Zasmidium cellare ATCC 36951]KAF2164113.1 hypothetical protein M409DRAFT_56825 [Zasmidium cellare ATCC 36951]
MPQPLDPQMHHNLLPPPTTPPIPRDIPALQNLRRRRLHPAQTPWPRGGGRAVVQEGHLGHPGWEGDAVCVGAVVRDDAVGCAVDFHVRDISSPGAGFAKQRLRELIIRIIRPRDARERREAVPEAFVASQQAREPAAVGEARGVDEGGVDAEGVLEGVEEVGRELLVVDRGGGGPAGSPRNWFWWPAG